MCVCMYVAYLQDEHQVENAVVQKFQSFLKKILSFAHTYIHAAGPAAHPAVLRQNARWRHQYIHRTRLPGILNEYVYANFQT